MSHQQQRTFYTVVASCHYSVVYSADTKWRLASAYKVNHLTSSLCFFCGRSNNFHSLTSEYRILLEKNCTISSSLSIHIYSTNHYNVFINIQRYCTIFSEETTCKTVCRTTDLWTICIIILTTEPGRTISYCSWWIVKDLQWLWIQYIMVLSEKFVDTK